MAIRVHPPTALICLLLVAAAACNSRQGNEAPAAPNGSEMASTAKQVDPCSYVSGEEVAQVIGEAIVEVKPDGNTCSYQTEDAMASSVEIDIRPAGGAAEMEAARSAAGVLGEVGAEMQEKDGASRDTGQLLADTSSAPAIGDEAFFGPNQQLHVLHGDVYFAVSPPIMRSRMSAGNPLLPADRKREMAVAIARKIAAKI